MLTTTSNVQGEIAISNFALQQLRISPIQSFDDHLIEAQVMKDNFNLAKKKVLSSFVFDWAHRADKLVSFQDDQGGYHQPADYIVCIGLGTESCCCCCSGNGFKNLSDFTHKFSVRKVNARLYIDSCCSGQCYNYLHYVYDNKNYDDMPPYLFEAIGYKLAEISAIRLSEDLSIASYLRQRYLESLAESETFEQFSHKPLEGEDVFTYPFNGYNSIF